MEEKYNAIAYPEGVERAEEFLIFLPDDKAVRDGFMLTLLQFLIQW